MSLQPLFVGGIEIFALVGIIILLFGASKIPELARSTGEATKEFERGKKQSENEAQRLKDELGTDDSD
jgi:sec-independent protein translocase protein TatA